MSNPNDDPSASTMQEVIELASKFHDAARGREAAIVALAAGRVLAAAASTIPEKEGDGVIETVAALAKRQSSALRKLAAIKPEGSA